MPWDTIFAAANGWALLMWIVLVALPRNPLSGAVVFYAGVGLLCFAYTLFMGLLLAGALDPGNVVPTDEAGSFTSIAGVRGLFASDAGITVGWIHYLALDMFAGIWIAKDADQKGFSRLVQAPVLVLTFMAGPAGLFTWLLIREKRARAVAGPRRKVNP